MKGTNKSHFWWLLIPLLCLFWGSNSYHRPDFVEKVERLVYDHHLSHLEAPQIHPDIVLIMVGEESIARLGQWPWPRRFHAKLLDQLSSAHTVVLDILFPETSTPEDDQAMIEAAQKIDNLVLPMHLSQISHQGDLKLIPPFPQLAATSINLGITNMNTDVDGLVRYSLPYRQINDMLVPSLPLVAAFTVLGKPLFKHLETASIGEMLPLDTDARLWINHGNRQSTTYEYYQVLHDNIPPEAFKDKIVMVGVSASGIEDFFMIPDSPGSREISGTQLNSNIIKSILTQKTPRRVSPLFDGSLTVIMVLIGAGLTMITRPFWYFISLVVVGLLFYLYHQHLFTTNYINTAFSIPIIGMVTTFSLFLFLRLKFLHDEAEIKTISLSAINQLPQHIDPKYHTYDHYIRSIWESIEKNTGIRLISPRTTWEDENLPAFSKKNTKSRKLDKNSTIIKNPRGPFRYLAMIPLSSNEASDRTEYSLLGWQPRLADAHIQAIIALLLSTSWYFELLKQSKSRKKLLLDTIHAISAAIDAKDPVTGGHSNRVSTLVLNLARRLKLEEKTIEDLYLGALIHDIGKIGIPDSVLLKRGKLTDEEFQKIRNHPSIGKKILNSVKLPETTVKAMYEHHERNDGSGYPCGLKENKISLAGRILAVADVFDSLISDRPYRKAWPLEKALSFMKNNAGVEYDERVVMALLEIYSDKKTSH